jgi:DNA-binding response OmpR family regulator
MVRDTPAGRASGATDKARVLIVDDDQDLAEAMADALAFEGLDVRIARNGAEGLDRIYERRPDVVVLDVQMPVLDGPGMVRRLAPFAERGEVIPIVLVSGQSELKEIAARIETPHFLRKPFRTEALVEIVTTALRERGDSRSHR